MFFGSALNTFGVKELLDCFVEIAPSPRPILAEEREIKPEEIIMFGNNAHEDGLCALQAGIKTYLVDIGCIIYPEYVKEKFEIINFVFNSNSVETPASIHFLNKTKKISNSLYKKYDNETNKTRQKIKKTGKMRFM